MQLLRQDMTSLFVTEGQDWSSKAIIAALDRQGVSLGDLENELGLGKNALRNVFYRKCGRYCHQRCKTDPPQRLKIDPGVNLLL
ncbi:helix-turn-helix domain-containing protein [Enterobacter asburiae]|uniref:helix-turn-helix domain-containing protein n=1 Tax=Enterobacter asburiae TaxID=61645 RepID=UPI003EE57486